MRIYVVLDTSGELVIQRLFVKYLAKKGLVCDRYSVYTTWLYSLPFIRQSFSEQNTNECIILAECVRSRNYIFLKREQVVLFLKHEQVVFSNSAGECARLS